MAEGPEDQREEIAMTPEEIAGLFVAESMRQYKKRGMATDDKSSNRMIAEIIGAALAEVLSQLRQEPDAPKEREKTR